VKDSAMNQLLQYPSLRNFPSCVMNASTTGNFNNETEYSQ